MQFDHTNHRYGFPNDSRKWTGATSMVALFHDKFDAVAASESCCKNSRSKWYGMTPEVIRGHWDAKAQFSRDLGHWFHEKKEAEILAQPSMQIRGQRIPTVAPITNIAGVKTARNQLLEPGLYVEHMMYDEGNLVCGIEDVVAVTDHYIDMYDHKTSFTIETASFQDRRMHRPIEDLPDASFWHHSVQMNLYMCMALLHNPSKKMGEMVLRHVIFEEREGPLGERLISFNELDGYKVKETKSLRVPDLQLQIAKILKFGKHLRS
jgi:hypothetical protein